MKSSLLVRSRCAFASGLLRWMFIFIGTLGSFPGFSQVSINTDGSVPDPSAMLEVKSTDKGMLVPRLTQATISAIGSPATGLLVYQTDGAPGFYYFNGTGWVAVAQVISGTTNYISKFSGINSVGNSLIYDNGTQVGLNTTTPSTMSKFHVSGVGAYGILPYYMAGIVADGGGSSANASGVYGEGGWRGVFGRNPGTAFGVNAIGVQGRCEGGSYTSAGYGLYGEAVGTGPVNYGIYASASGASTTNYGIYAKAIGVGYAGYFVGNVHITGSISKGSGTFKIDHPLDPENKYLYHSFVESPDMMNIYNGNIVTDASGDATVTLPDYFEALNRDFRYQLTVLGVFAQAIIAEKVNGNHFKIKTDKPNVEVSWQVTGVRQDKYAEAHRVIPEVNKEPQYKGYYLHAAEWNMPESKSIDFLSKPLDHQGN